MIAASPDALPIDVNGLRAMVLAERAAKRLFMEERDSLAAERDALNAANEKLQHIIAVLRRARFGRKSERLSEDQLALVLEELEAEEEKKDEGLKRARAKKRRANRGALPSHLQRIEQIIEPENRVCPSCGKAMHAIGEERSERLDKLPAVFRVIVTRRPKYACACGDAVAQAPAPPRLIEGGIPTEALIANSCVAKCRPFAPVMIADDRPSAAPAETPARVTDAPLIEIVLGDEALVKRLQLGRRGPTQDASVERSRGMPWREKICAWC